jgi:putative Holliday junction resolvase
MSQPAKPIQQFLAFDWGKLRVGVASGNTLTQSAQSVATLSDQGAKRLLAIQKIVQEWRPHALVVGIPFHPDGHAHKNTQLAKRFAAELRSLANLPVHEVDERYSTTEAKADNPNAKERHLDGLSACIILEQYMRNLPP